VCVKQGEGEEMSRLQRRSGAPHVEGNTRMVCECQPRKWNPKNGKMGFIGIGEGDPMPSKQCAKRMHMACADKRRKSDIRTTDVGVCIWSLRCFSGAGT
jgi:hypothetical protein